MTASSYPIPWRWLCVLLLLSSYGGRDGRGEGGNDNTGVLFAFAQVESSSAASVGTTVPPSSPSTSPSLSPPSLPPAFLPGPSLSPTSAAASAVPTQGVGVNVGFGYSTKQINATHIVSILKGIKASSVKLFGDFADAPDTTAFIDELAGTGIDLVIPCSLAEVQLFAANATAAEDFVLRKVVDRLPRIKISTIALGNEVLLPEHNTTYWYTIVPAMRNVHKALEIYGLDQMIKVITPLNFNALSNTYPPSAGIFNQTYVNGTIRPLLQFLNETGSSFMVNIYPFYPTRDPMNNIDVNFALGVPGSRPDVDKGIVYTNMVDMMMDALVYAIEREGFFGMPVAVGEVGWPTGGHPIATVENGAKFNNYLVGNLMRKQGTPKRPGAAGWMQVYIFELLDEDLKPFTDGNGPFENHWGMYYIDGTPKYPIDLSKGWIAAGNGSTSVLANPSIPAISPTCVPGDRGGKMKIANSTLAQAGGPNSYCVANDCASDAQIQLAIDWLCGVATGDCSAVKPGGLCFVPDTVVDHANYLFNEYYVSQARVPSACAFGGSGMIVDVNPSYGNCVFH